MRPTPLNTMSGEDIDRLTDRDLAETLQAEFQKASPRIVALLRQELAPRSLVVDDTEPTS